MHLSKTEEDIRQAHLTNENFVFFFKVFNSRHLKSPLKSISITSVISIFFHQYIFLRLSGKCYEAL